MLDHQVNNTNINTQYKKITAEEKTLAQNVAIMNQFLMNVHFPGDVPNQRRCRY